MHGIGDNSYAYGMWLMVLFNVGLFVWFTISFIQPQKRAEWRTMGVFIGFIAALFAEMYGLPLTIYLLAQLLGASYPVLNPFSHAHGHLWLVLLGVSDSALAMTLLHLVSNAIIIVGFMMLYHAWVLVYNAKGRLVTEGLYARLRHPQYVGLFLITLGLIVQWPTLISLLMWPVLLIAYYRLARREEADVSRQFPAEYAAYKARVLAFFPRLGSRPPENKEAAP